MNEVGYKLIIDKRVKRRIDILNILLESNRPRTLIYLAKKCSASERTISADITLMNQLLPEEINIMTLENLGVSLVSKNSFLLTDFINDQLEGNPLYTVIESIFNGEEISLEDLSIRSYISESRLRTHLLTLQELLSEYSLSLKMRPYIDIVGDEVNIRFFFFQYFRHAHESALRTPSNDQYKLIFQMNNFMTKEYSLKLTLDCYRLSQWLLIFEQRIATGHFVQLPTELIEQHSNSLPYKALKSAYQKYLSDNTILKNIPEEEFLYFFLLRLDSVIYDIENYFFMKTYFQYLASYESIILEFFFKNDLHPIANSSLKTLLQSFFSNVQILSRLTPLFQKTTSSLKKHVKSHYSDITKKWLKLIKKYENDIPLNCFYMEDIAINLALITVSYTETFLENNKKILFSLTGTPTSLNYFKARLLSILPRELDVHFNSTKPLTDNLLSALDIDICVHNYHLINPITHCKSIRLSNIPTETEWLELVPALLFE